MKNRYVDSMVKITVVGRYECYDLGIDPFGNRLVLPKVGVRGKNDAARVARRQNVESSSAAPARDTDIDSLGVAAGATVPLHDIDDQGQSPLSFNYEEAADVRGVRQK